MHDPAVQSRPVGTVTFLFTDMEGSTRAWELRPAETAAALKEHDEILTRHVESQNGMIILERGEGDSVFAVFARPSDAVAAACQIQREIGSHHWPGKVPVRLRMAIHTGEAGADYRGPHVNRAARIRSIAHGGQVLISGVTAGIVRRTLPDGASLVDLGRHRLRDVAELEQIFQLAHPDLPQEFPPLRSLSNFRQNLPVQLTSFVGRQKERETMAKLLESHRLVTLAGAGGTGKTRLAVQVGSDLLERYGDGVRFVDLAPLDDETLVMDAVATAVGVTPQPVLSGGEGLVRHLEGTTTLIILDNCEHVRKAAADVVLVMLRA